MAKKCYKCLIEKDNSCFSLNRKRKDGLSSLCKTCHNDYYKKYYSNASEKQRLYESNKKIKKLKREITDLAKDKPCLDCGIKYPSFVMDFDHRDPSQKKFNISSALGKKSISEIEQEIAKCDVVCSNCHRIRTYKNTLG